MCTSTSDCFLKTSKHAVLSDQPYVQKFIIVRVISRMAVSIDTVKAQNDKLKSLSPGQVGVFVGGTAGIGEFTLKAFAQRTTKPKIYIVGR